MPRPFSTMPIVGDGAVRAQRSSGRRVGAAGGLACALAAVTALVVGCSGPEKAANSLPPLTAASTSSPSTLAQTTTTEVRTYVVRRGDNASEIAVKFNVPLEDLILFNNLADANDIEAGQTLQIPPDGGLPTTSAPP